MAESKYSEKLKDPRWQKKRLEIFQRDGWKCRICGDKDSTLVVHHRDYLRGRDPWEYPDPLLMTLCEDCHHSEMDRGEIEDSLIHILRAHFLANNLASLNDAFSNIPEMDVHEEWMISNVIFWMFSDPEVLKELDRRCWEWMNSKKE